MEYDRHKVVFIDMSYGRVDTEGEAGLWLQGNLV
jgi:hypothetical protein